MLRRWDPVTAIEERHGLAPGALFGAAFAPDLLHRAVTGAIDDARWRAEVAAALGAVGERVVGEWSESAGRVDPDVLDVLRRYRMRAPVALLSNATSRLPADLARLGLAAEFDRVFSSWQLGVAKPDPRVFALVCAELGTDPAGCRFIDDTPGHVEAARAAGLDAHRYRDAPTLARFLDV